MVTGYAITGADKGNHTWKEVRLIDMKTGEEIKSIYSSANEVQALNARTGKAVVKKDIATSKQIRIVNGKKVVSLDDALSPSNANVPMVFERSIPVRTQENLKGTIQHPVQGDRMIIYQSSGMSRSVDKPFSTLSAAMA